jgi:glutaredoxin
MRKKISVVSGLLAVVLLPAALMLVAHHRLSPPLLKPGETLPTVQLKLERGQDTVAGPVRRVLILYKASCTHCQRTIRELTRLRTIHSDWFATGSGISVDLIDISGKHTPLPDEVNIPFSIYWDERGQTEQAFKGSLTPYVLFVNEKNIVQYSRAGELTFDQEQRLFQNFYRTGYVL